MDKKDNIYPHSFDTARQNGELDTYHESRRLNESCAKAINDAINNSNTSEYHYDPKAVIAEYGAERMNYVLANTVQNNDHDGRFSQSNKNGQRRSLSHRTGIITVLKSRPTAPYWTALSKKRGRYAPSFIRNRSKKSPLFSVRSRKTPLPYKQPKRKMHRKNKTDWRYNRYG